MGALAGAQGSDTTGRVTDARPAHLLAMQFARTLSFLVAALVTTTVFAQVQSQEPRAVALRAEMREAEQLADALRASADMVSKDMGIGTMFHEVDTPAHTCYTLGKLLGLDRAVQHLRFSRKPMAAHNEDEAHEARVKAQSMENFVTAAIASLSATADQKAIAWNLDCAPRLGNAQQTTATAAFFEVLDKGRGIRVLGAIEPGFTRKLTDALSQAPKATFVALGSGGGSVDEALAAGKLIRARKLDTVLWNNCYSACPLVFLGGVERLVYAPYPSLGFHQLYTEAGALPRTSPVYARVANYVRDMGADEQFYVGAMLSARPDQMATVSGASAQLCQSRVVTWAQRACVPSLPK